MAQTIPVNKITLYDLEQRFQTDRLVVGRGTGDRVKIDPADGVTNTALLDHPHERTRNRLEDFRDLYHDEVSPKMGRGMKPSESFRPLDTRLVFGPKPPAIVKSDGIVRETGMDSDPFPNHASASY